MVNFKTRYITVSMDVQPDGFAIQAWMSPDKPHPMDLNSYPHLYTYMGDACTWFIYSSCELTPKLIKMTGEQADRLCIEGRRVAEKRLAKNR